MIKDVFLRCAVAVVTTLFPIAALADDQPDFLTMEVPSVVSVCKSPDLLKTLNLSDEQDEQLQAMLGKWKTKFLAAKRELDSRPEGKKRRWSAVPRRDNGLKNAISDLLDDRQHQVFHQMLESWVRSPVQSRHGFQFDLGLTPPQHVQLYELEVEWILHGLKNVPCDCRYPRHTEPSDRSGYGKLRDYGFAITRLAWQFLVERNAKWNKILTPAQAKRWKERELQWAFQLSRYEIMLVDFSSVHQGLDQLRTGTWLDSTVPYYTPPFQALQWSDEQIVQVQALVKTVSFRVNDLPPGREERESWMEAHRKREVQCMRQIEEVMTAEQQATWWGLIGEPAAENRFLRELKANSLLIGGVGR